MSDERGVVADRPSDAEDVGASHIESSAEELRFLRLLIRIRSLHLLIRITLLSLFFLATAQIHPKAAGSSVFTKPHHLFEGLDGSRWRERGGEIQRNKGGQHVQSKEEAVVDQHEDDVAEVEDQAGDDEGGCEQKGFDRSQYSWEDFSIGIPHPFCPFRFGLWTCFIFSLVCFFF